MGASVSLWRALLTLIVRVATTPSRRPSGLPLRARPKHASGDGRERVTVVAGRRVLARRARVSD